VSHIGWDELLKTRSSVFVMEEEYRMQKAQGDMQQALGSAASPNSATSDVGSAVIYEDGSVRPSIDDKASTRALVSPPSPKLTGKDNEDVNGNELEPHAAIPTIRISTESLRAKDGESEVTKVNEDTESIPPKDKGKGKATEEDEETVEEEDSVQHATNGNGNVNGTNLNKPVQAAGEGEQNINEASPTPAHEPFSFSNKRLCERWLDNLFMVLYEVCQPSLFRLVMFS